MKSFLLLILAFFIFGCSSIKVRTDSGMLTHENLYQVPILEDESWLRLIPLDKADALYLSCPNEQRIVIFYTMLCGKYDYATLTSDDYVNRIYLNTYFSGWEKVACSQPQSPLTDKQFKRIMPPVVADGEKKSFSIVYETTYSSKICSSDNKDMAMKVMDVFMEEPKFHFWGGAHTRFVVLRYISPAEHFDSGITEFQDMVSKFRWID